MQWNKNNLCQYLKSNYSTSDIITLLKLLASATSTPMRSNSISVSERLIMFTLKFYKINSIVKFFQMYVINI